MSEYLELVEVETLCRQSLLVEEDESMARSIECRQPSDLVGFQRSLRLSVIKPFSEIKPEIDNIAISDDFMYPGCKLENIRYLYYYNQAAEQWCYDEGELQNKTQRASEGSLQEHIQSLNRQDQEHIQSLNRQDQEHFQSLNPQDQEHIQSLNRQDQEHIQSLNPQDQDDIQSLNPKNQDHIQSLNPKDQDHIQSLNPKNQDHIQSLNYAALEPSSSTDFEHVVFHAKKQQSGMSCVVRAPTSLLEPAEVSEDQAGGKSKDSGLGSSLSKPGQESTDTEGKDGPQSWKRPQ